MAANSLHDEVEEVDPAQPKHGWQRKALADDQAAWLRSQARPMASAAFISILSMKETRLLFLLRLELTVALPARSCRCGRPLDVLGHHQAACANAGVLGRRGWVLENVACPCPA